MIAVTTHSRLRGLRYTIPMLAATKVIGRELRGEPSCYRYANVVTGPREFWTVTMWRDGESMRSFMRGGAHGRIKWSQPRWLECYWGMRWQAAGRGGEWEGLELVTAAPARGEGRRCRRRWRRSRLFEPGWAVPSRSSVERSRGWAERRID